MTITTNVQMRFIKAIRPVFSALVMQKMKKTNKQKIVKQIKTWKILKNSHFKDLPFQ